MKEKHVYTSDQKLEWFGHGEWVAEPDVVKFQHAGFKCYVVRVVSAETNGQAFGGHLCGYVQIPENHPWYEKRFDEIVCDCHGGLTFAGHRTGDETFWVGFDCSHCDDITPSIERFFWADEFGEWTPTYKNIRYAIEQCKSIAVQAKNVTGF